MKSLLYFGLLYTLCPGILACLEEQQLESSLQQYLALNKSCQDTLFPQPSCCGVSNEPAHRIVNGTVTGRSEFTWTVFVMTEYQNFTSSELAYSPCGGSLINSFWVITAAHCFANSDFQLIGADLHIGEWDRTDTIDPNVVRVKVPAKNIITHPNYHGNDFDLSLMRMEHPVKYSDFINPICLPFNSLKNECYANKEAVITGWGRTSYEGNTSSKKLKTTVTVMENCLPLMICTTSYDGMNSFCNGDSGGPLSFKLPNSEYYYLLGAVSMGSCRGKGVRSFYSKIDMKWVLKVVLE